MLIHKPSDRDILAIQQHEQAFYWSACCENLLRKHGIIPWSCESGARAAVLNVYTRASMKEDFVATALIEGPLPDAALAQLGIAARLRSVMSLELYVSPEQKLSPFEYPKAALFAKDPTTGVRSEPYPYVPDDARYHKETFCFQTFHSDDRWKPVLFASVDATEELHIVAVTDGRRLVLGIPLIDLLCAMMAWSALPDGYYRMTSQLPSTTLEVWLVNALRDLALTNGHTWVRIPPWPYSYKWACTVRADYDRLITDAQLRRLLALYESQSLRATWCFLEWSCPAHQVHLLKRAGHEIALHTGARTGDDFNAEIASIQLETGLVPKGVTSHGGDYVGFLGDAQYRWAENASMGWSESIGRLSRFPYRVVHLVDEIPRIGSLMLMSTHTSLDAGTKPDQHYLDRVLKARKSIASEGGHLVFMNHPDLHEAQVFEALNLQGMPKPWAATFEDVAQWTNISKYETEIEYRGGEIHAAFSRPIPFDFRIEIETGAGRRSVPVATGDTRIKVM